MKKGYFVTGTDTEVGKTFVSCSLLTTFNQHGKKTAAMKPVASGCQQTVEGLRNDDALQLQAAASVVIPYFIINPYAFEPAIAPHIAAQEAGVEIEFDRLLAHFHEIQSQAEITLVEGAGGWRVPLNPSSSLADLAVALQLPVILVVGIRLGCINHALLTVESIHHSGLPLAGWVANRIDPHCTRAQQNIATLKQHIPAPCLGVIPFDPEHSPADQVPHLDITTLL